MPGVHDEETFESAIEQHLLANGYIQADVGDYDPSLALDSKQLFAFIGTTQAEEWSKLVQLHGESEARSKFLNRLQRELDRRGSLDVLRRGVTDLGVKFRLAYFKPAASFGPDLVQLYEANRLSVTRQVPLAVAGGHAKTVDLVLFVNGIPVVTAELKNPPTGQTYRNAIKQYRTNRNPKDPLFAYPARALVHFAVDPDEVHMTTKLALSRTRFLPLNKGRGGGKGNPDNPNGYKTAYLWEEVLQRDSLLDLIQRFITIEYAPGAKKVPANGTVIFPRYHQLGVVRQLEADARESGPGKNYLVMHSTGSGKSLSIAWAAHRLFSLHNDQDERVKVVDATSNPGSSCDQVALRRVIESTIGGAWGTEAGEGDLDVLCIRGTDFDTSSLLADKEGAPIRGLTHQEFRGRRLVDGDLLIEKSGGGENQPVGRVIQWRGGDAAVPTNFAARLRPAARIDSRYLVFVFRAAYEIGHTRAWIKQLTGIQNLDLGGLLSEKCQIPSFADQVATAERLDEATTDRLRVVTLLNHQADLLAEHRQALITAAVTGEIAMPGVAA